MDKGQPNAELRGKAFGQLIEAVELAISELPNHNQWLRKLANRSPKSQNETLFISK